MPDPTAPANTPTPHAERGPTDYLDDASKAILGALEALHRADCRVDINRWPEVHQELEAVRGVAVGAVERIERLRPLVGILKTAGNRYETWRRAQGRQATEAGLGPPGDRLPSPADVVDAASALKATQPLKRVTAPETKIEWTEYVPTDKVAQDDIARIAKEEREVEREQDAALVVDAARFLDSDTFVLMPPGNAVDLVNVAPSRIDRHLTAVAAAIALRRGPSPSAIAAAGLSPDSVIPWKWKVGRVESLPSRFDVVLNYSVDGFHSVGHCVLVVVHRSEVHRFMEVVNAWLTRSGRRLLVSMINETAGGVTGWAAQITWNSSPGAGTYPVHTAVTAHDALAAVLTDPVMAAVDGYPQVEKSDV